MSNTVIQIVVAIIIAVFFILMKAWKSSAVNEEWRKQKEKDQKRNEAANEFLHEKNKTRSNRIGINRDDLWSELRDRKKS